MNLLFLLVVVFGIQRMEGFWLSSLQPRSMKRKENILLRMDDLERSEILASSSSARDVVDNDGWPLEIEEDLASLTVLGGDMNWQQTQQVLDELSETTHSEDTELSAMLLELRSQFQNRHDEASHLILESIKRCEDVLKQEIVSYGQVFAADARAALAAEATMVIDQYEAQEEGIEERALGLMSSDSHFFFNDDEKEEPDDEDYFIAKRLHWESEDEAYSALFENMTVRKQIGKPSFVNKGDTPLSIAIGMDLGTTNSAGAVVLGSDQGKKEKKEFSPPFLVPPGLRPSVVCYVDTNTIGDEVVVGDDNCYASALGEDDDSIVAVVGKEAEFLRNSAQHAASVCSRVKRIMGRDATAAEVRRVSSTNTLLENKTEVLISIPALKHKIAAVDISAEIARQVKRDCDLFLSPRYASRCVVGVPARFDQSARENTRTAVLLAGFDDVELIQEPEAAVLAYAAQRSILAAQRENNKAWSWWSFLTGAHTKDIIPEIMLVFDLGGGTFDVSVVELTGSEARLIAIGGDAKLGGDDFDAALAEYLALRFYEIHNVAIRAPTARLRLLTEAERCKRELSSKTSVTANARCLARVSKHGTRARGGRCLHLNETLDRATFESICRPILRDLEKAAMSVLEDASTVLYSNDRTSSPSTKKIKLDAVLLVGGATRMPCVGRMLKKITGLPLEKIVANDALNPDEAVALGAAIHAHALDQRFGYASSSSLASQISTTAFFTDRRHPSSQEERLDRSSSA
mmetsp:Transcript_961/g.1343  ORF Transcript_961/g.1343 Transcript_961/m.1343 type:complete len:747 (-) Transcript_961:684-2924(-)